MATCSRPWSWKDYREYEGGCWRVRRLTMVNHKPGKEMDLLFSDYAFRTGLADRDFVNNTLKRLR